MSSDRNVLVLLSGGIDSTTCVAFYAKKRRKIVTVFFDIGQQAVKQERKAARSIAKHYKTEHREISIRNAIPKNLGEIPARNAFLLLGALMESPESNTEIVALGIHSGSRYFDSTKGFIGLMQALISGYTDGKVRLAAPLLEMTKPQVFELAVNLEIPIKKTRSCQAAAEQPCGTCESCQDRIKIDAL